MTLGELLDRIDTFELTVWQVLEVVEAEEYEAAAERAKTEAADEPGMEVHVSGRRFNDDGTPIDDDDADDEDDDADEG